jgi:hypothetical protein
VHAFRGGGERGLKRKRAEDGRNKRKRGLTTQEKEQEKEGSRRPLDLRAIGVGACICHRQDPCTRVLQLAVALVFKFAPAQVAGGAGGRGGGGRRRREEEVESNVEQISITLFGLDLSYAHRLHREGLRVQGQVVLKAEGRACARSSERQAASVLPSSVLRVIAAYVCCGARGSNLPVY